MRQKLLLSIFIGLLGIFPFLTRPAFAATTTTLYLPSYDRTIETNERNTYYAVPGMTMQR